MSGALAAIALLLLLGAASLVRAQTAPATPLTKAAQVLALPVERAREKLPVSIRGVVTAAEPDWQGRFFIQDDTAGIFVHTLGKGPAIGELLELTGLSSPGSFAPVISSARWQKIGTAPLPLAKQIPIERLMAGVEDSQRVEIVGVVRSTSFAVTRKLLVEISVGGYRVRVYPKLPPEVNPESLIAAKVRARGTAATAFNTARRQLTAVNLFVPTADDFVIEQPESQSPFDQSPVPLGDVARYRSGAHVGERVHVQGTVTFQRPGLDLFVQDETGGLHVESLQAQLLEPGRRIDAVGFLEFINFQPVLRDAVFRPVQEAPQPPVARGVPVSELRSGLHPGELIVLRGRILDRTARSVQREAPAFSGVRTIFTLQTPELTFSAECEEPLAASAALTSIPLGSLVEVRGIATIETGDDGKLRSLTILLPDARALRTVSTPSWFTAERLLIGLLIVTVLLASVAGWSLTVSKKNAMLSFLVAEREKAQRELQQAHDHLEQRVKERTEQLKVEMTVRKAAEVEFHAVLAERTRLARELHDTLEQALTGIALQLDTALKLFRRNPADAGQPLELARGFLRQSQLELRRSIWDLRSRELDQFDLSEALAIASRQITAGANIRCEIETRGACRELPELIEENLLRIGQEALTNVVKHSGATLATVKLECQADIVSLEVKDNGAGLDPELVARQSGGHFGLLGMSERVKRLGGRFELSSAPGEGTTIRVTLSLAAAVARAEKAETATTIV